MFGKMKKSLALALVFVLMLTGITVSPKLSEAEEEASASCQIVVAAPYQEYLSSYVSLTKNDLTRDYGIGLPTDGSDGYSALRLLAKAIVMSEWDGEEDPSEEQFNDLYDSMAPNMSKYLGVTVDGFVYGISPDGKTMNAGTTRNGAVDTTGYWNVFVNGHYSDIGSNSLDISKPYSFSGESADIEYIEFLWSSSVYGADGTYGDYGDFESSSCMTFDGKKVYDEYGNKVKGPRLVKDTFQWNDTYQGSEYAAETPVAGGTVILRSDAGEPAEFTTDEDGFLTLPKGLSQNIYFMFGTQDEADDNGNIVSRMTRAYSILSVIGLPGKAKNVKAKVSGKKSAKKKTIKVTWKNPKKYEDWCDSYQVYVSTKKKSGYKLVGNLIYGTKCSFKKKKGSYYVKVRARRGRDVGTEDNMKTIYGNGSFTTQVKVKVK